MSKLLTIVLIFMTTSLKAQGIPRGEIQRYTLLHDRKLIDKSLKEPHRAHFFDLDLAMSSGLRDLISDVSSTSDSSSTAVQKQVSIGELLSKNVNTEKYVDVFASIGIPLPDLKWGNHTFYNSLFYEFGAGITLSITNRQSVTNPRAQTYVRKQIKRGLATAWKPKEDQLYEIALYQLLRADTQASLTSSDLASDGEFFNLDDLERDHEFYALDFIYTKRSARGEVKLGAKELQLLSASENKSLYGTSPLLFSQYTWFHKGHYLGVHPFVGIHYRKWYPLHRGLYGGAHFKFLRDDVPFSLILKMSNQFLTVIPQFKTSWFHFTYSFKNPYRNPQDNFWVANIHNIQIHLPFP